MDTIWQGVTWRRVVTIQDESDPPAPIDPAELVAALCPEQPITVTQAEPPVPGEYFVTLTDTETADLCPGTTHWQLLGRIGADVVLLVHETVVVQPSCARMPS